MSDSIGFTAKNMSVKDYPELLQKLSKLAEEFDWRFSFGVENAKGKETLFDVDKMGRVTKITNPLNNETAFSYDLNGNVTARTNALEEVTSYQYDSMNRVTNIVHEGEQQAGFEYNLAGTLTSENTENTESQFAYDSMGKIIQSSNSVFSVSSVVNYSYNLNGNRTALDVGDLTVNYTYNAENLTTNITFSIPSTNLTPLIYSSSFDYDDALRLSDIKYANNVEGTFDYDAESRVVGFTYKTNNIAFIDHTIIRNEQGFKTHQLIDAGLIPLFPENQRKISTYNDVDQLTSEQIQTDAGWLDADYTWNANGCLSSIENEQTYEYDYNNRLIESIKGVNSAEYIYDASGARVARIFTDDTTSTTNFFIIDHTDSLKRPLAETDAEGNILRYYIWNGYMLLAHIDISENQNPTVTFYHQDELGNTLALTDSNGQVTDQFAYMPYGSTRHQVSPFTLHPSPFSRRPSPFLWLGGYGVFYEPELDIHLTVHRAYSADLRRFISPDPLGIDSFPNLYAYANMNPLFFIDPWGLCADGDPLGREDRYAERSQYLQDTREYINQSWPKGTHWFAELFLDMFDIGTSTSLEAERSGLSPETSWVLGSVEGIAWGVSFEALADASIYTSVEVVSKLTKLGDDMIHGREYKVGKDGTRIAPGGNRTGHPTGERPHYHRRVRGKGGNVKRGQGTDRHRPWDTSPEDKTFGDRF